MVKPLLVPGIYFRLLFIGYFEGIDSERGIAWRAPEWLALRDLFGVQVARGAARAFRRSRARG
jgi:transposase